MPTKCIIDGNSKSKFIRKVRFAGHIFNVVKCTKCGLYYVYIPDKNLKNILDKYYLQGGFEADASKPQSFMEFRERFSRFLRIYYSEADSQMRFLQNNGLKAGSKIFDIGCGYGTFIIWLEKNGYKVGGSEPDKFRAEKAYKHLKRGKIISKLYDTKIPKNTDIISLLHVVEHLVRPDEYLRKLRKENPNSQLFIEVPNSNNKGALAFSMKCPHNYHFSPENLHLLLKKSGWNVIKTSTQKASGGYFSQLMWMIFKKDVCKKEQNGWSIRILAK